MVGSSIAYASLIKSTAGEIVLVDIDKDRRDGEVMDMSDGLFGSNTGHIYAGDYSDCRDADVIVITAGIAQKPEQTRLEIAEINSGIIKSIFAELGELSPHTKVLIVSNPVDILTKVAKEVSNLPETHIFGSGTYLDSSRMRQLLSRELDVSSRNVHGYILGEHGDSSFAAWSTISIGGRNVTELLSPQKLDEIEHKAKNAAYEIISKKGATYYAIGIVTEKILESILNNKMSIIPVSTFPGEQYGVTDVCIGIPAVIGANGIHKIWQQNLSEAEMQKLQSSASKLRQVLQSMP